MKIIMNRQEKKEVEKFLSLITDGNETKSFSSVIKHHHNGVGEFTEYTVEINEKYIYGMLSFVNDWIPSITGTVKGLVKLIESFIGEYVKKEQTLVDKIDKENENEIQF